MAMGNKSLRVLVTGEPYFVRQLQAQLSSPFLDIMWLPDLKRISRVRRAWVLFRALRSADVWYQLQGCAGRGWSCELALRLGVPVVLHWLGTDVTDALRYFQAHPHQVALLRRMTHWTFSPWLKDELSTLGLEACFMPFPQVKALRALQNPPPPLPERFGLVTYIRDERPEFYGWEKILTLARSFPEIPIRVLGTRGEFAADVPANVEFCGWIEDPLPVLEAATVLVRVPEHDGLSGLVVEALALGRHVVWTYHLPGVHQVHDEAELIAEVQALYQTHQRGALALNLTGWEYVATQLHPQRAAERIAEALRGVAETFSRRKGKVFTH